MLLSSIHFVFQVSQLMIEDSGRVNGVSFALQVP